MYTAHGHHIPGTNENIRVIEPSQCGGITLCELCRSQVEAYEQGIENREFKEKLVERLTKVERALDDVLGLKGTLTEIAQVDERIIDSMLALRNNLDQYIIQLNS